MKIKRFICGSCVANSYVLASDESKTAVLFDSCGANDKILEYLQKEGYTLSAIFLTHGHFDHIAGLSELKEKTGAKIYIFDTEEKFLSDFSLNLMPQEEAISLKKFADKADVLLKDGDKIKISDIEIEVIHTPGHTSGCVCYKTQNVIFTGDTLFKQSIGRSDFPTGDYSQEIESIHKRLMVLEDDVRVYPGHGFSTTIGNERRENPFL